MTMMAVGGMTMAPTSANLQWPHHRLARSLPWQHALQGASSYCPWRWWSAGFLVKLSIAQFPMPVGPPCLERNGARTGIMGHLSFSQFVGTCQILTF